MSVCFPGGCPQAGPQPVRFAWPCCWPGFRLHLLLRQYIVGSVCQLLSPVLTFPQVSPGPKSTCSHIWTTQRSTSPAPRCKCHSTIEISSDDKHFSPQGVRWSEEEGRARRPDRLFEVFYPVTSFITFHLKLDKKIPPSARVKYSAKVFVLPRELRKMSSNLGVWYNSLFLVMVCLV